MISGIFQQGGPIMVPLGVCSLLIWAIALEKWRSWGKFERRGRSLFMAAEGMLQEAKIEEVRGLFRQSGELLSRPVICLLDTYQAQNMESALERRLRETEMGLKRHLWILGTVASSAPFIGLFGTVVGIIKSLESIAISGKGGFSVVAAGLAEALIATATGIFVAIMATLLYNYFLVRFVQIRTRFRIQLEEMAERLEQGPRP